MCYHIKLSLPNNEASIILNRIELRAAYWPVDHFDNSSKKAAPSRVQNLNHSVVCLKVDLLLFLMRHHKAEMTVNPVNILGNTG